MKAPLLYLMLCIVVNGFSLLNQPSRIQKRPVWPLQSLGLPKTSRWPLTSSSCDVVDPKSSALQATASSVSSDDVPEEESTMNYNWTRQNLAIALPALIGMLADPLLSLMDTAFVGNVVGAVELAALGACTSIFHLAFNMFRATTAATTSLVARSLQQETNGKQEAQHVTQISLQFGILLGIAVSIFLQTCGSWCLATMGVDTQSPLFKPASQYLSARSWAGPAVLGIVVAEGAFRGYGNTKIPLIASICAALINLVLDPVFMLPPLTWGVAGAASATALAQLGAAVVYAIQLQKNKMLPPRRKATTKTSYKVNTGQVIQTILSANVAMMAKQGSLLLAWAYATSRATRLGAAHVAAHQIALSFWLVFAIWLDGAAVSAQVLMSRAAARSLKEVRSLTSYMIRFATLQGVLSSLVIFMSGTIVTHLFTPDPTIRQYLTQLIPHLAGQQVLISLTLVLESLAVGGHQFNLLAFGTTISTFIAMNNLQHATDVVSIWSKGIVSLFVGRLLTALVGCARVYGLFGRRATDDLSEDYSI